MAPEDLADFLFEVASPERLVILSRLSRGARSHTELARGLKRSGSETTRHLQRLAAAGLVTRGPCRKFELTTSARVFNAGLGLFEFLVANKEFLRTHDLGGLDPRFLARLGEVGGGTFTYGQYGTIAVQETAVRESRARAWIVTEEPIDPFLPTLRERALKGTDVRIAAAGGSAERIHRFFAELSSVSPLRVLNAPGLLLMVVDDRAGVSFPLSDGTVDRSTMLTLNDPLGLRWAEDLFLDCWSRAKSTRDLRLPAAWTSARPP